MKLFCVTLSLIPSLLFAELVEDFSKPSKFIIYRAKENNYKLESSPNGASIFAWKNTMEPGVPIHIRWVGVPLPVMPARRGIYNLTVRNGKPKALLSIVIRMEDSKGEFFQFRSRDVIQNPDGTETYSWSLPDHWSGSWGKNSDKKIDWPLSFSGIGCRFDKNVPESNVEFIRLEFESAVKDSEKKTKVRSAIILPGETGFHEVVYGGKGSLEVSKEGLVLKGTAKDINVVPRNWSSNKYEVPSEVLIHLNVKAPLTGGRVALLFHDDKPRISEFKPFHAGIQTVSIPISVSGDKIVYRYLAFDFPKSTSYEIVVTGVESIVPCRAVDALVPNIETGDRLYFLEPGKEKQFSLTLKNCSESKFSAKVHFILEDFFGNILEQKHDIKFQGLETKRFPLEHKLPLLGHWNITAEIEVDGARTIKKTSFVYMEKDKITPMSPKGEFLFGMNVHLIGRAEDEYNLMLDYMTASGVKLARATPHWDSVQPACDKWDFTFADKLSDDLQKRGIAQNFNLLPTPKWAAPAEVRSKGYMIYSRSAPEKRTYGRYAEEMAKRYHGKVLFWEIWNEPDLYSMGNFNADAYIAMLKEGYRGIKKYDPNAWVTTGGFASLSHPNAKKDFQRDVLVKAKGYYDIHAYHEHGSFGAFASIIDSKFIPLRKSLGVTVPWYANETGVTAVGGQDRMQAMTVFKKIMYAWAKGSVSYIWYQLRNEGWEPFNGEQNYGLLQQDFHPKSGYAVYAVMSRLYRGMKFDSQIKGSPGEFIFRFRDSSRIIIGAWNEANLPGALTMLETDAQQAERVDIMGNRTPVPVKNGHVIFQIENIPSSLVLYGATKAVPGRQVVIISTGGTIIPGRKREMKIKVCNPFQEKIHFNYSLNTPRGACFSKQNDSTVISPGGDVVFKNNIELMPNFKESKSIMKFTLDKYTGYISIPLNMGVCIGKGDLEKRKPDFVIDKAKQVFDTYRGEAASIARLWQGPEDLSARVWLEQSKTALQLKIVVEDDVHCQKNSGMTVWKSDNIQLSFQLPGQLGFWEIGLTRLDSGKSEVWVWIYPSGFDPKKTASTIRLQTSRKGTQTVYHAEIPYPAVGLTEQMMREGFKFNMLVNEDDGKGRNGWISLAPGFTGTLKNPSQYPTVVFE